ncbi:MAG: glycoside hydrolase family 2 TIM barrel-domain containing protein [Spirochaetales bacterium]|uniref:Glycoside hydrolase family 2 TIM barrel-domain containing protein n=1 Tax=Candidatus Thalassospirochaeta sargassi TaxID=3119039 RepID=A0AAJ1MIC3_9SPIO|nr:glycoside hydrolase family 2 TIM barrel-domain containing protein [Spirochaetales bacterium]
MRRKISTVWSEKLKNSQQAVLPLSDYPRPQMERDQWMNLNGYWDYTIISSTNETCGRILVPFAVECSLSGVGQSLQPDEILIYSRNFRIPEDWEGSRIILNFEAVDYDCRCSINGVDSGSHRGGYLPFSFDITDHLIPFGLNEIILSVKDPSDAGFQQRGKQVLNPGQIYYTATSGIWQTVWLEPVSSVNYIHRIFIYPDLNNHKAIFRVETADEAEVSILISKSGRTVAEASGRSSRELTAVVVNPEAWSPEKPVLYNVKITILNDDSVLDRVFSYFAFRTIEVNEDENGKKRIFLNGRPVFLHAPLDQGYWPESGMTPPSDEAIIFDISETKALGFNCTRKHIKVEPRRWYYHADRLGLMVMQDAVSGGRNGVGRMGINLLIGMDSGHRRDNNASAYKRTGRIDPGQRILFERELEAMINHLGNHHSIIMWIPFNEAWGQFDSMRIADSVRAIDASRLIDPVSGWWDQGGGDFRSRHTYSIKLKIPPIQDKRIYFISEYGGYNLQVPGHLWDEERVFGYKKEGSENSLEASYTNLIRRQLIPLIKHGLSAAVYTQLTDVEIETNGFFTYDRKVLKINKEQVKSLNDEIFAEFNRLAGC